MGQQLLETAVFCQQGFRMGDHGEKSLAAHDHQLFSDPGHGDIKPVEDLVGIGPGWDLRVEKDFFWNIIIPKQELLKRNVS